MTEDDKWKLHRRAENYLDYNLNSNAIRYSMSPEQITRFTDLCEKYARCFSVGTMLKGYNAYGYMLIKLGIRAPSMTDDEADFVKTLFDNHMYKTVTHTQTVKIGGSHEY